MSLSVCLHIRYQTINIVIDILRQNVFFYKESKKDATANDLYRNLTLAGSFPIWKPEAFPNLLTQLLTLRSTENFNYRTKSKYICRPERILYGYAHYAVTTLSKYNYYLFSKQLSLGSFVIIVAVNCSLYTS